MSDGFLITQFQTGSVNNVGSLGCRHQEPNDQFQRRVATSILSLMQWRRSMSVFEFPSSPPRRVDSATVVCISASPTLAAHVVLGALLCHGSSRHSRPTSHASGLASSSSEWASAPLGTEILLLLAACSAALCLLLLGYDTFSIGGKIARASGMSSLPDRVCASSGCDPMSCHAMSSNPCKSRPALVFYQPARLVSVQSGTQRPSLHLK